MSQEAHQTKVAEAEDDSKVLNIMDSTDIGKWILDSSCTYHVCPNRSLFTDLVEVQQGTVMLGNNQICKIVGMGTIKLQLADGSIKRLTDVRLIPQLKRNLISIGTLESKGYNFKSIKGLLHVM